MDGVNRGDGRGGRLDGGGISSRGNGGVGVGGSGSGRSGVAAAAALLLVLPAADISAGL
jgi:hypothetical protein